MYARYLSKRRHLSESGAEGGDARGVGVVRNVRGGGDTEGNGGGGTGFGLTARPVGAYVIRDGQVRWEPAFDLTRVAVLAQVAVIVAFLSIRSIGKAQARTRLAEARGG
jgi:hypothetical protein